MLSELHRNHRTNSRRGSSVVTRQNMKSTEQGMFLKLDYHQVLPMSPGRCCFYHSKLQFIVPMAWAPGATGEQKTRRFLPQMITSDCQLISNIISPFQVKKHDKDKQTPAALHFMEADAPAHPRAVSSLLLLKACCYIASCNYYRCSFFVDAYARGLSKGYILWPFDLYRKDHSA